MKKNIFILLLISAILIFLMEKDNPQNNKDMINNVANYIGYENIIENKNVINTSNEIRTQNVIFNDNSVIINQVLPQNELPKNSLENKTIAFFGDSLIEGYGNDFKGIDYYLKEQLGSTYFINNSKSGSTLTDNTGDDNIVIINQARTLVRKSRYYYV